jgi:AAA domain/TrwC relaxase
VRRSPEQLVLPQVRRSPRLRLCCNPFALVSLLLPSLLPLLSIFRLLTVTLLSRILILLAKPSDQCTSERARSVKIVGGDVVAVMATVAKGYDLDYAWRAVGEAYRGAGYYLTAAEAGEPPGTWWGPGAERLGFAARQPVEREPYNLLFGQRKGPDGQKLGRTPANAGKAVEIYRGLLAAEPGAGDHRKAELRIMAQRQARQSPLYFDLTTSWSKDISIFHASLGAAVQRARDQNDKRAEVLAAGLLAEVDAILRDANDASLAYLQREAGYVRAGSHMTRVDGRESGQFREADLVVASWYQHTSRDGDMQLHHHNQIAHVACTRHDGKWRAPDSTAYYEHARAAGQIASVHAESALTCRFGLEWVPRPDGMGFGIDGVGADLMDVFSHRRDVISDKVAGELVPAFQAEYGRAPNQRELASLMDKANLRTRKGKGKDGVTDWEEMTRGWQAKAARKAGVDLASLYRRVSRLGSNGCAPRDAGPELTQEEITRAAHKALERCSREGSTWTRADLIANLGRELPRRAGDPARQTLLLEEVADSALAGEFGRVLCLVAPEAAPVPQSLRRADGRSIYQRHGGIKYTTRVQLSREEQLVTQAGALGGPRMSREDAARALGATVGDLTTALHEQPEAEVGTAAGGLRLDQAAAAFHVLTSDRRVEMIVGPAGSGKTRVLAAIAAAWSQGRAVGVTPSQASRDVLAEAGVAESYNFAQFLGHLKYRRGARGPVPLHQGDLIVIDEASMIGNPDFADIVGYAVRTGAKVAVALDHQQLQAVENGGGASLVTRKQGYVQLREPVRFTEQWERSASLGLREGKIAALADYAEHGRIRAGPAEDILEAAAYSYVAHRLDGRDSLLIARSHELRRELSRRVRDDLQHLGLVAADGPSIEIAGGQQATAGDLIVCTENDHSVDVGAGRTLANMHVLRIESITPGGPVVRRMLEADPQTQAPRWTQETFVFPGYKTAELAYAVTEHVAQGRTVAATRTIVSPGDDRQGTYVGATRGIADNVLMVITPNPKIAHPQPLARPAPELVRFRLLEEERQGQAGLGSLTGDLDEGMAVLADVLGRDATELAASEYREREFSDADHLGLLHAIWLDLTERADADRFRPVVQSALADIWGVGRGQLDTPTARWLYRTMRAAELAGEDPALAVRSAVASRDLTGARDIPAVIDARLRRSVHGLAPRPGFRWSDRIPQVADPKIRPYLAELAALMEERRERLGAHAAEHSPQWAVNALAPVPEDPGERDLWRERASAIGAYRELFGYDDERQPIGPEPVADHPDKRALWHDAWRALGPVGGTDLRDRSDGSLWLIRDQYQTETAWAPKHVARELGYVRASAEDARLHAVRSEAEAEAARKAGNDEVAGRHEQQAEQSRQRESAHWAQESILAGLMDDRRAWEAATEPQRRLAVAADAELRRRNPEMRIEPLRSAEPEEVTDRQRADFDAVPGPEHEYQPPSWLLELAEARTAFSEKIAERQSLREPHEDPNYADIGQAFPAWQHEDRQAVLQPPKPPIPPSERLAERQAEAGERHM